MTLKPKPKDTNAMTRTTATYEHITPGFPGVALKWSEVRGRFEQPYIVVNGIIRRDLPWRWRRENTSPEAGIVHQLDLFDQWVRRTFSDDPSVQG